MDYWSVEKRLRAGLTLCFLPCLSLLCEASQRRLEKRQAGGVQPSRKLQRSDAMSPRFAQALPQNLQEPGSKCWHGGEVVDSDNVVEFDGAVLAALRLAMSC